MGGRYGGSGYRRSGNYGGSVPPSGGSQGSQRGSAPTLDFTKDASGSFSLAPPFNAPATTGSAARDALRGGYGELAKLADALAAQRSVRLATLAMDMLLHDIDESRYGITIDTTGYQHNCGPRDPGPYLHRVHGPYGVPGIYTCIGVGSWGEPLQPGKVYGGIGTAVTWLSGPLSGATGQYEGWQRTAEAQGAPAYQSVGNESWDYDLLKAAVNAHSTAQLLHSLGLDVPPHSGGIEDRRTAQDIADEAAEYADWLAQQAENADWFQDPFSDAQADAVPDVFPATPPDPRPLTPDDPDPDEDAGPDDEPAVELVPDDEPAVELYPRPEELWEQDLYPNRWRPGRDKKHKRPPIPFVGALTEAGDMLECYWKGLDKADQTKVKHPRYFDAKKGKWVTKILTDDRGRPITHPRPHEMAMDIYKATGSLDLVKVMECIRENFLEDYAIGKSARKGNEGLLAMNPNRAVGLGTGPAL